MKNMMMLTRRMLKKNFLNRTRVAGGLLVAGAGLTLSVPVNSTVSTCCSSTETEPTHTEMPGLQRHNKDTKPPSTSIKTKHYDFVIVGAGNAGRSALETLRSRCPKAEVAIVDPLRTVSTTDSKSMDHFQHSVLGIYPKTRTVVLDDEKTEIKYHHSILIATGSRGAPPPPSLIDHVANDSVFELRSTVANKNQSRPILAPHDVRKVALMASSQGLTTCVLGSGFEALELAILINRNGGKAMLTFGSAAPLSHILPRYLSTAVTRRLRQHGIDVMGRSLVRYVAKDDHDHPNKSQLLELHTVKSYDLVDTQRSNIHLLIVAPYVNGPRGTGVVPVGDKPLHVRDDFGRNGNPWYNSWSQVTGDQSMVVCYADDGRIVVNAELNAASHVYAAGGCAKFPSSKTGHAHVAGEGSYDGALAGKIAATHMSRDYHEVVSGRFFLDNHDDTWTESFANESMPLVRSDLCTYIQGEDALTSSLSSVGISCLCVGQCDSDKMATHGYWWTNASIQRRHTNATSQEKTESGKVHQNSSTSVTQYAGKSTIRRKKEARPVYGTGVVYYLDRSGKICGIMCWGLPFTSLTCDNNGNRSMNENLFNRLKEIIRTNTIIAQKESIDSEVLKTEHLAEESKKIADIALGSTLPASDGSRKVKIIGQPLYRYTAAKSANITSVGMIKRKDQTGSEELIGENLYVQNEDNEASIDAIRPQNLVYVYPMETGSLLNSIYGESGYEQAQLACIDNELRSRPPKEEPLWFRRGDSGRMTNHQEAMKASQHYNMKGGHYSDGTDAIKAIQGR